MVNTEVRHSLIRYIEALDPYLSQFAERGFKVTDGHFVTPD